MQFLTLSVIFFLHFFFLNKSKPLVNFPTVAIKIKLEECQIVSSSNVNHDAENFNIIWIERENRKNSTFSRYHSEYMDVLLNNASM